MIIVTGAVTARADSFDMLKAEALAHVHRSRTEPGCISHAVHIDAEDGLRLVFFEEWADMVALRTHFEQPGSLAFMRVVRDLAARTTPMAIYEAAIATRS